MSETTGSTKGGIYRFRHYILGGIVLVALAVGGAMGLKMYKFRQGAEYALQQLVQAAQTGQAEVLSSYVDFRTLAQDLAENIYAERPQTPRQDSNLDTSVFILSREMQQQLLDCLLAASSKGGKKPATDKAQASAGVVPLPPDFFQQLGNTLRLTMRDDKIAVLQGTVRHPQNDKETILLLNLEKRGDKWFVTRLVNAKELIHAFMELEDLVARQRELALVEKNQLELQRMNSQLGIHSCSASVHVLSDKRTAMLVVTVIGMNKGPENIYNMNLAVKLNDGEQTREKRLNMAQRLLPGENFTYTWRVDMDVNSPEYQKLALGSDLSCQASPTAMTLGNGPALHLRETKGKGDDKAAKPGTQSDSGADGKKTAR